MASAGEQFFITSLVEKLTTSVERLTTQSAEAHEAASKRSEEHHEAMRKHHEEMIEKMRETHLCFEFLNSKASVVELRQCTVFGEGTDAARMWAQWADGENANPSPESLEKLRQSVLLTLDSSATSYQGIFGVKDMARSESIVARFIEQAIEKKGTCTSSSEHDGNVGKILAKLPLFRGEIMRAHDKKYLENNKAEMSTESFEKIFPTLSESDRALFQLVMPMDKQRKVFFRAELRVFRAFSFLEHKISGIFRAEEGIFEHIPFRVQNYEQSRAYSFLENSPGGRQSRARPSPPQRSAHEVLSRGRAPLHARGVSLCRRPLRACG